MSVIKNLSLASFAMLAACNSGGETASKTPAELATEQEKANIAFDQTNGVSVTCTITPEEGEKKDFANSPSLSAAKVFSAVSDAYKLGDTVVCNKSIKGGTPSSIFDNTKTPDRFAMIPIINVGSTLSAPAPALKK